MERNAGKVKNIVRDLSFCNFLLVQNTWKMNGITSNICATATVVIFNICKIFYNVFLYMFTIYPLQIKEVSRHALSIPYIAVTSCKT
jgi:hypothetical protein